MNNFSERVPIPAKESTNVGLSAAHESTMMDVFGRPGVLSRDCSNPSGPFLRRVRYDIDVGPFKVSGLDYAIERLKQIFLDVGRANPELVGACKTAGCLCVRHRRSNPARFSNHSWGTAIDLYFGEAVVPQGERVTERGIYLLAPYFNRYGWYWGAEFSGDSVDSMHFELAEETIRTIPHLG